MCPSPKLSVIDLTDDGSTPPPHTKETIICPDSPPSVSNDFAIIRTLAENGISNPLPLPVSSSPVQTRKRRPVTRTASISEDISVLKTVKVTGGTKPRVTRMKPVINVPSDPPPLQGNQPEKKCPICFDVLNNPSVTLCGHVYCTECITTAARSTKQCPICRRKMTIKGFHPLYL